MRSTLNIPARRQRGFTMIEMIGVLSVISILAALIVPRVFSVITSAKVGSAGLAVNGIKSASLMYYGKYGKFGDVGGTTITNLPFLNYDSAVLMREGFLEKPLSAPVGLSSSVQLVAAVSTATAASGTNSAYNLDGNSTNPNDAGIASAVLQVVFYGVTLIEARDLNRSIDGDASILAEDTAGHDILGRVKYDFGSAQTGDVYCYVAHR